jgi:hypothetical protein
MAKKNQSLGSKQDATAKAELRWKGRAVDCPFYGHHLVKVEGRLPFLRLDQDGNECALIVDAYSPCQMEIDGRDPDWKKCPIVESIRRSL